MIILKSMTARFPKQEPIHIIKSGLVFAKTIDERFETEVISCHPDITDPTCNCIEKFTLKV